MSRVAVRVIVIKDNKLLAISRSKYGQQYMTLPGGGVERDETLEAAAMRELAEETSVTVSGPKLVAIEESTLHFGRQYIFFANYVAGTPMLAPSSGEAKANFEGKNTYYPDWLPLGEIASHTFYPKAINDILREISINGLPKQPMMI